MYLMVSLGGKSHVIIWLHDWDLASNMWMVLTTAMLVNSDLTVTTEIVHLLAIYGATDCAAEHLTISLNWRH